MAETPAGQSDDAPPDDAPSSPATAEALVGV